MTADRGFLMNTYPEPPVTFVHGYGLSLSVQEHSALSNISFRERLMAESTLVNITSNNTDGFNLQLQGNGNGRGGTCSGDSGGPVFLGKSSSGPSGEGVGFEEADVTNRFMGIERSHSRERENLPASIYISPADGR